MPEKEYYIEIECYIKKNEVNKKTRLLEENYETIKNNWEIGRLIVEAQGGEKRAKYGNELIKKWSIEYSKNYGNGYSYTNMTRFRQFYLAFPILAQVVQVSWGNILRLLPMKDINRRNYYLNLCIKNNLSRSELLKEIKSNSYERLINKSEKIEIVGPVNKFDILSNMKNPIILEISKKEQIKNEKDLELIILSKLRLFFRQLGEGFTFMDNQYKIAHENKNYFIDILLFNYKLNCFVVVELKLRELKKRIKPK